MKVLHVTQNYFPSQGGTQHTIKKISEYLNNNFNDKVQVYTTNSLYGPNNPSYKKIQQKEEYINGVFVKRFYFFRAHRPLFKKLSLLVNKTMGKSLPFSFTNMSAGPVSFSMKRAILCTDADIIAASSVHFRFADYGTFRKYARQPKPFVLYGALHLADDYIPLRYLQRINAADRYIANTSYEKDFLIAKGVPEKKIEVIGAATNILDYASGVLSSKEIRQQLQIPLNNRTIVYIGRQEVFKGISILLSAFEKLGTLFENTTVIIAGAKGTYTEALQQFNNPKIKVLTDITNEVKCNLLSIADVVVLPSKEESFGVVFLEAWSFKKPVIGVAIGAIASIINNCNDGLLFEADNANDLAEKIKLIFDHPEKGTLMGQEGYTKVQKLYTWDIIARRFRHVYEDAINDFKSRNYVQGRSSMG